MIASAAGRSGLSKNFPDLKTILLWLGVLALPWIWLWTKWVNPSFSMVDDAADLMLFRHMREDFGNWLTTEGLHGEIGNGRLRPLYWLFRFVFYYLPFGENPASWQAVHYVLLALILTAVFVLMKRLTQSSVCAFTACALWTINPKTMENFCRFGPAECWQLLWFSLGMLIFYFLLQGKNESKPSKNTLYALLFTVLFCLYFTKETSVLLMPVSAVMALLSVTAKRNRRIFIVFFGMNVLLFALQRLLSPPLTGYSTAFSFSAKTIWDNLNRYPGRVQWGLVFLPATAFFLYRIIRDRLQNRKPFSLDPLTCWELLFLALGIIFFLILLPWAQPTPRYLVVTDFFFSLFMAVELRNAFLFINAKWPIDEKDRKSVV